MLFKKMLACRQVFSLIFLCFSISTNFFKNSCISLLFLLFFSYGVKAEVVDKIVAVIGDEVIVQSDIDKALAPVYVKYKSTYENEELAEKISEAEEEILNQLIEERLILSEAKRQKVEVKPEEIDSELDKIKSNFFSEEGLNKALSSQGITLGELRKKIEEQIKVRKLLNEEVRLKIVIGPTEIANYYSSHMDDFIEPEEIKVSNILIRVDEGVSTEEAYNKALEVLDLLNKGDSFSDLAKKYSQSPNAESGGSTNFIKRGELIKEIEDVIFNLPVGAVSEVVKSDLGYHIFKVEEKRDKKIKSLAEVYEQVEDVIFKDKTEIRLKEWIDELKKNAYISIRWNQEN